VLSGAIKYQESPNVDYVVAHGAGVYAPGPERVAQSVAEIIGNNVALERLTEGIRKLAQPDAIWKIADEIWSYA
jgi:UDP-N-acetylglucosamine:LPS N-acetylglucosamine transferase